MTLLAEGRTEAGTHVTVEEFEGYGHFFRIHINGRPVEYQHAVRRADGCAQLDTQIGRFILDGDEASWRGERIH